MKKNYELLPATAEMIDDCVRIIEDGKAFQKEQGFTQWTEDYPNKKTIEEDVAAKKGYVLMLNGAAVGYMCIDGDGEPAYEKIEGAWLTNNPYVVVHRMAFSRAVRGQGVSKICLEMIEDLCFRKGIPSIRMDTDFPNARMQHILEKNGYVRCGIVIFQGSGKIAYEKVVAQKSQR